MIINRLTQNQSVSKFTASVHNYHIDVLYLSLHNKAKLDNFG